MLLTRAPVAGGRASSTPLPLDLHVLSLSLAFILSQDQTLRCCYIFSDLFFVCCRSWHPPFPSILTSSEISFSQNVDGDCNILLVSYYFVCCSLVNVLLFPCITVNFPAPWGVVVSPVLRVQSYGLFNYPPNFFTKNFREIRNQGGKLLITRQLDVC